MERIIGICLIRFGVKEFQQYLQITFLFYFAPGMVCKYFGNSTPLRFCGNFPRNFRIIRSHYEIYWIFVKLIASDDIQWLSLLLRLFSRKPPICTLITHTSRTQRREVTIGRPDSLTPGRRLASSQMTYMLMQISRGWEIPLLTCARKCTKENAFLLRNHKILQVVWIKWNRIK